MVKWLMATGQRQKVANSAVGDGGDQQQRVSGIVGWLTVARGLLWLAADDRWWGMADAIVKGWVIGDRQPRVSKWGHWSATNSDGGKMNDGKWKSSKVSD